MMVDENDEICGACSEPAPFKKAKHNIIDVSIIVQRPKEVLQTFQYRDFKGINSDELVQSLANSDWGRFDDCTTDTEAALEILCGNLTKAIDALAPLKTFKPKSGRLPWVDTETSLLTNKWKATYRRYRRTKDIRLYEEFLRLRSQAESKTTEARTAYYSDRLFGAGNSNSMWKELRSLGLLPKQKEDLNGISPTELNEHFAGVSISNNEDPNTCQSVISAASEDGFRFKEVTINDVILSISHFSSQAVGEDGVPQSVVLKALPFIGSKLVNLFNSSLREGIFPSLWKRAHVVPLKKSTLPTTASDFRPIALLCFLSKVLEKIVHGQLMEYLLQEKILDPYQTGFRPHHSTQTALLKLTDDIRIAMDRKRLTLLLLFDFSKAFDKISPSRLLTKLKNMGFSRTVLKWIISYLTGREQTVTTKSQGNSPWLSTNIGVPQGSVLGPLLFCLYINDVRDVLNPQRVSHLLYADDLQIYVQVPWNCLDEGIAFLEEAATAVFDWANSAAFTLNCIKTKAIVFELPFYIKALKLSEHPGVRLVNVVVPFSKSVTSLGVALE